MNLFISKEKLHELYVVQELSTKKIGEMYGKHRESVRKLLIYYDIPRRSGVEAWQIRKENGDIVSKDIFPYHLKIISTVKEKVSPSFNSRFSNFFSARRVLLYSLDNL